MVITLKAFFKFFQISNIKLSFPMAKVDWSMVLVKSMNDPELQLISTDTAVVIRDKYPKAKHHFLVLPKKDIPSIYHLGSQDLELLDELYLLGINAIELVAMKPNDFKIGFHAKPSLQRLHLHVISRDFNSQCLKTKKHWNSFNTALFLAYEHVYTKIKENGSLQRITKEEETTLSANELMCNKCNFIARNMPNLKSHLITHLS